MHCDIIAPHTTNSPVRHAHPRCGLNTPSTTAPPHSKLITRQHLPPGLAQESHNPSPDFTPPPITVRSRYFSAHLSWSKSRRSSMACTICPSRGLSDLISFYSLPCRLRSATWTLCSSLNVPGQLLPQGLCTYYYHPNHSLPQIYTWLPPSLTFFPSLLKCHFLREAFQRPYLKLTSL